MAWSQLAQHKAELESQLTTLKQQYTDKHPDVITKQTELESVKHDMDRWLPNGRKRSKQEQEEAEEPARLAAANVENRNQADTMARSSANRSCLATLRPRSRQVIAAHQ